MPVPVKPTTVPPIVNGPVVPPPVPPPLPEPLPLPLPEPLPLPPLMPLQPLMRSAAIPSRESAKFFLAIVVQPRLFISLLRMRGLSLDLFVLTGRTPVLGHLARALVPTKTRD